MYCLKCAKKVDKTNIQDLGDMIKITVECHGDVDEKSFTPAALDRIAKSGRDIENLPFFESRNKRIHLVNQQPDPEGVTTLKSQLKDMLKVRRPGWFRGEGSFSERVLLTISKALDAEDALLGVKADLNQIIPIAKNAVQDCIAQTPEHSLARIHELNFHLRSIERIKDSLK